MLNMQRILENLGDKAANIKLRFLGMYREANAGHVGCALSCAEILTFLRFAWMDDQDDLLLSKGHAAAALYSLLAEGGELTQSDIASFYKEGTLLSAHPPPNKLPRVPFATGSLGHGLSLAAGLSLGARFRRERMRTFCVTSDGELNEGSTWEAALFAAHHGLDRLTWIVDRNGIQGFGRTEEVLRLEPLRAKIEAFGWDVVEADGHDFTSLLKAKMEIENRRGDLRPAAILCDTIKGKGLEWLEDSVDCHYLPLKEDIFYRLTAAIEAGRPRKGNA